MYKRTLLPALLALPTLAPAAEPTPAQMLREINQIVTPTRGSEPSGFTTVGNYTYFFADDGITGREL
jgi:hypothetical protein